MTASPPSRQYPYPTTPPPNQVPRRPSKPCCLIAAMTHLFGPLSNRPENSNSPQSIDTPPSPSLTPPPSLRQLHPPAPLPKEKINDYLNFIKKYNINKITTGYHLKVEFIHNIKKTVKNIGEFHNQITNNARINQQLVRHYHEPTPYNEIKNGSIDNLNSLKEHFHQDMDRLSQMNLSEEDVLNAKNYFYSLNDLYNAILSTEEITGESSVVDLPTWKMTDSEWNTLSDTVFKICKLLIKQHFTNRYSPIFD